MTLWQMKLDIIGRQQKITKVEQTFNFNKLVLVNIFKFSPYLDF
jgi:hypothetical protein